MAYRYIKTDLVQLTPELAETFDAMGRERGERPFNPQRFSFLQSKLDCGKFYPPRWRTCYVRDTQQIVRIDGQHSSRMLASSNGSFPIGMVAIIDRFECDTIEDLEDLFCEFDSRKSARTTRDMISCAKSLYELLDNVDDAATRKVLDGLAYKRAIEEDDANPSARNIGPEERAKMIHHYSEFILWCDEFARDRTLRWDCVIAAVYATWLVDKTASLLFWREVRDESGEHGSVSRALQKLLRDVESVSNDRKARGTSCNRRELYAKCIHGWNAWRGGRSTRFRYTAGAATPLPI